MCKTYGSFKSLKINTVLHHMFSYNYLISSITNEKFIQFRTSILLVSGSSHFFNHRIDKSSLQTEFVQLTLHVLDLLYHFEHQFVEPLHICDLKGRTKSICLEFMVKNLHISYYFCSDKNIF